MSASAPFPDHDTPPPEPPAERRIKLQGLRRASAQHMVRSARTIPHYSFIEECDVTELTQLRKSLRELPDDAQVKLTYLPFIVKAVATALAMMMAARG